MKRILVCLMALMMLMTSVSSLATALADISGYYENTYIGMMFVYNCDEWVSLRRSANTSATRLMEVPLGAVVYDCAIASNGFIHCQYHGQYGYILAEYLRIVPQEDQVLEKHGLEPGRYFGDFSPMTFNQVTQYGDEILSVAIEEEDLGLIGHRAYREGKEGLKLVCFNDYGEVEFFWSFYTETSSDSQNNSTNAFLAGTQLEPRVLIYNRNEGLLCLDLHTGEEKWFISKSVLGLGTDVCCTVGADGTIYIGGYNSDPMAISNRGSILWKGQNSDPNINGLLNIELQSDGILCSYAHIDAQNRTGVAFYSLDGKLQWSAQD